MRDGCGDALVDEPSGEEALQSEGLGDGMGSVVGDGIGEDFARAGDGFEAAGSPAAVEIEALHIGCGDDGRAVAGHVDDAAPLAQHSCARDDGEHLDQCGDGVLDGSE